MRQRNLVIDAAVCQAKHITWLCCSADIQRSRDLFCGLRGSCRTVRICARDAHRGFARGKAGKRQGERAVCVQLDIVLAALDDILLHAVVIDCDLPSERLFGLGKQLLVVCVLYGQRDRIGVAGINRNVRRRSLQLERCRNFDRKARDVIAEFCLCDDRADVLPDECDIVAVIRVVIRGAADYCRGLIVCELVSVFVIQLDFRRLIRTVYIAACDEQMRLQERFTVFIIIQSAVFRFRFDIGKQVELLGIFFPQETDARPAAVMHVDCASEDIRLRQNRRERIVKPLQRRIVAREAIFAVDILPLLGDGDGGEALIA